MVDTDVLDAASAMHVADMRCNLLESEVANLTRRLRGSTSGAGLQPVVTALVLGQESQEVEVTWQRHGR